MRRIVIATIFALVGLAACDVEIEIRRGKHAAPDAGALIEAPPAAKAPGGKPDPAAGTTGAEAKPAPKDKSLKRELGDVWNRVERDGKELARDAEDKARELAHDAEKKGGEIKQDVERSIEKKDVSAEGLLSKIPRWGWVLIALGALVLIGGLLGALDIFEGFFEALGKLLAMLVEILVKAAVAAAKGFVSLVSAIANGFRRKRRGCRAQPEPSRRPDLVLRRYVGPAYDDPVCRPRPPAPPQAPEPPRRSKRDDDDGPGIAEAVGTAVVNAAEAVGEAVSSAADAVGDIDIDLD